MEHTDLEDATVLSLHSVKNMLGEERQVTLFDNHDETFSNEFSISLRRKIDRFGVELSEIESRVMEGILKGFSQTKYKGNSKPKPVSDIVEEQYDGKKPNILGHLSQLPRLKTTQAKILEWSGINRKSIASVTRAVEAIEEIGTKQFCFYYERMAVDENGSGIRNKDGTWKKEQVSAVDTLFTIKHVRQEGKQPYYEILPSPIFLDQLQGYFMLVPFNWREEVRKLYGNKKTSNYTMRFLLFLRYQFEIKTRKNAAHPFKISWSPQKIAEALKVPEDTILKRKKRTNQILEDAYSVAKKLGYLSDLERLGSLDVLTLNHSKYTSSRSLKGPSKARKTEFLSKITPPPTGDALDLFMLFHHERKRIDPGHNIPDDKTRDQGIQSMQTLLESRSKDEIERVIKWASGRPYWTSRISTPGKLVRLFSETVSEMNLSTGQSSTVDANRDLARRAETSLTSSVKGVRIEALSKHVEIGNGIHQPNIVEYQSRSFREDFKKALSRWQFQ